MSALPLGWGRRGAAFPQPLVGPKSPQQGDPCEGRIFPGGTGGAGLWGISPRCIPPIFFRSRHSVGHMRSSSTRTQASLSVAGALQLGQHQRDHRGPLTEAHPGHICSLGLGPSVRDFRGALSKGHPVRMCASAQSASGATNGDNGTAVSGNGGAEAATVPVTPERLWAHVLAVREKAPLVQSITNFVVMNNSANALLAVGASPIMAHGMPEMDEMVSLCQALVVNIGTLDEYFAEAMFMGANQACALGKPWVLDPVGAGATAYRDDALQVLLEKKPAIIRGNASEILALAKQSGTAGAPAAAGAGPTKGVDSTAASTDAIQAGRQLSEQLGCVVSISGEADVIIKGSKALYLCNGHPMMTKVTGLGCSLSAVTGAFAAVTDNHFEAAAAAAAYFGVAGQLAAQGVPGPGSLQLALLDRLYNLTEEEFWTHLRMRQDS